MRMALDSQQGRLSLQTSHVTGAEARQAHHSCPVGGWHRCQHQNGGERSRPEMPDMDNKAHHRKGSERQLLKTKVPGAAKCRCPVGYRNFLAVQRKLQNWWTMHMKHQCIPYIQCCFCSFALNTPADSPLRVDMCGEVTPLPVVPRKSAAYLALLVARAFMRPDEAMHLPVSCWH